MENKKINVYIPISPSHILNFEQLILETGNEYENILLNPGGFKYNAEFWDVVIGDSKKLTSNETSFFRKIKYQLYKIKIYKLFIKKAEMEAEQIESNIAATNVTAQAQQATDSESGQGKSKRMRVELDRQSKIGKGNSK